MNYEQIKKYIKREKVASTDAIMTAFGCTYGTAQSYMDDLVKSDAHVIWDGGCIVDVSECERCPICENWKPDPEYCPECGFWGETEAFEADQAIHFPPEE